MSINKFGIATAIAAGGILAAPALGGLTGLSYEYVSSTLDEADYWTVRVYADMGVGERLDAVAGNGTQSKVVSSTAPFYQNSNAGPTSKDLNCAFFGFVPSMEWDSYVTIGCLCQDGSPFPENALSNIGIEWGNFENNGGTIDANNGTWFVTADDAQGASDTHNSVGGSANGVLIGQFTILGDASSSMTFEALFQGREADGIGSWQEPGSIIIPAPAGPVDCNDNGAEDSDDIADGTSEDCNANGVPDECDLEDGVASDCNGNGTPDSCDIADGSASDCDGNGTPDSCDIDAGAADCDGNGVPDSCDLDNGAADCNGNSVPDSCDIDSGSSEDCDGDGTPDECETDSDGDGTIDDCEYTAYRNVNLGDTYDTAFEAIMAARNGDLIEGDTLAVGSEFDIDFMGKSLFMDVIALQTSSPLGLNTNASIELGPSSRMQSPVIGGNTVFNGDVTGPFSGNAAIGGWFEVDFNADVRVRPDTSLEIITGNLPGLGANLNSDTLVMSHASMWSEGDLSVGANGTFTTLRNSSVTANVINNNGAFNGQGTLNSSLSNTSVFKCNGTTVLTGDCSNAAGALISVNVGTMYCMGDVFNGGTIIGDFNDGPVRGGSEPGFGDGMNIGGNYSTGPDASITFAHENWKLSVGGHFDVAINDSTKFNMGLATIRMYESGSGISTMEAMSQDLGETLDGLDSSIVDNFPLGTLEINGHVMVVDDRTNTENGDEIVYVKTLVVENGATFDANGRMVWCEEIINNGTILGDVEVIDPEVPCDGNLNGDGVVNIDDLLIILSDWGGTGGDANGDGQTNIDDILVVLGNWGACV